MEHPLLMLSKPLVYLLICALAMVRWRASVRPVWWRPLAAALLRLSLGLVVGVPLGWLLLVLDQRSDAVEFAVFLPVRVGLWAATAWAFFRAAPRRERVLFAVLAAVISAALEFAAGGGHGWLYLTYHTRFC